MLLPLLGQLPMFLGWIVVLIVDECVALSLAELASRSVNQPETFSEPSPHIHDQLITRVQLSNVRWPLLLVFPAQQPQVPDHAILHYRLDVVGRKLDHNT